MGTLGVVYDTNVLVSALGFGGTPLEALLAGIEDEEVRLVASEEPLGELGRVMKYDRLPFTPADRTQFLTILRREADIVKPDESVNVVRDSDDDKFLEVARAGDASLVVSGDEDLLEGDSYADVEIVPPGSFVSLRD